MNNPYIGQIGIVAFPFPPRMWATCDGQLLSVAQNQALFSLVYDMYGGDGRTTFALPDMRGRAPIHQGQGTGLHYHQLASKGGAEIALLSISQLPSHSHNATTSELHASVAVKNANGDTVNPDSNTVLAIGNVPGSGLQPTQVKGYSTSSPDTEVVGGSVSGNIVVGMAGGSSYHNNMQPYLVVNYVVALYGLYPQRN